MKYKHKRLKMTPKLRKMIEKSRKQIANGKCTICRNEQELKDFLESLGKKRKREDLNPPALNVFTTE